MFDPSSEEGEEHSSEEDKVLDLNDAQEEQEEPSNLYSTSSRKPSSRFSSDKPSLKSTNNKEDKALKLQEELREQLTATIIKGASRLQRKNLGHFKNVTKVDNYLTEIGEPQFEFDYNPFQISGTSRRKHKKSKAIKIQEESTTDTHRVSKSDLSTPNSALSPRDTPEVLGVKSPKSKEARLHFSSTMPLDASNPSHVTLYSTLGRNATSDNYKNTVRQNIVTYINNLNVEDARSQYQKEIETLKRSYEAQIGLLAQERDTWRHKAENAVKDTQQLMEQLESQKHVNAVMRKKLSKLSDREVLHQRKLRAFTKMEPIFETLAEKYELTSPSDVIDRLENLERTQLESYSNLLEAREQKSRIEKELKLLKTEKLDEVQKKFGDLSKTLLKSEKQIDALQLELEQKAKALEKTENIRNEFLVLTSSIIDLWQKFTKSELVQQMDAQELPDMSKPAQVIEAITSMLILHNPPTAAKQLRSLSGLANTLWLKYCPDNMDIKAKPKEIFIQLAKLLDHKVLETYRLQTAANRLAQENKLLEDQIQDFQRQKRQLQATAKG